MGAGVDAEVPTTPWGHPFLLAYMPSGDFLKFATEAKATAFQFAQNAHLIFRTPEELAGGLDLTLMKEAWQRLTKCRWEGKNDPKIVAKKLWPLLQTEAKNPYEVREGNPETGKQGKRASIRYHCVWRQEDEKLMAIYKTLPKQAKVCLELLYALELGPDGLGENRVSSELLEKYLNDHHLQLKTKQDVWRIFKYYQAKLISEGLIQLKRV